MKISFTRLNSHSHELRVHRADGSSETATLETSVFFLHDLAHFVVEKMLDYRGGFWGMLAVGHALSELNGKTNPLTEKLRFIEKIVGPVQSAYMGHFPAAFVATATSHLSFPLPDGFAEAAIMRIGSLEHDWKALPFGGILELDW